MMNRRVTLRGVLQCGQALIILVCCAALCGFAAETAPVSSEINPMWYLFQTGHLQPLDPGSEGIISEEEVSTATSKFQSIIGSRVTGNLEAKTASLSALPNYDVEDAEGRRTGDRTKRYIYSGSRWEKKNLTYAITKYSKKLDRETVDGEIARAFALWSKYSNLTFTPQSGEVDIEISFVRGEHNDGRPFNGSSDIILAHAFYPENGDIHFNDDKDWTINGSSLGYDLFEVGVHEIGHSLGLMHSNVTSSVMWINVTSYNPNFKLDKDDIAGIQNLYRSNATFEDFCIDPKVDVVFSSDVGTIDIFKGKKHWKMMSYGFVAGYPKPIAATWKELPEKIDAAFTYNNGKIYFFKGSKYWRYSGAEMDGDYPKKISEGFSGIPDNIDAVTTWNGTKMIYFFRGTEYWKYDPSQRPQVQSIYPKPISNWKGVPDNLDAIVAHKREAYFIKGHVAYSFNDTTLSVHNVIQCYLPNGWENSAI